METYRTTSAAATRDVGARAAAALCVAPHTAPGAMVVTLSGDLGAGKTTLAQGLLAALGAEGPYASPTFTIVRTYEIKVKSQKPKIKSGDVAQLTTGNCQLTTVYHIDPYRIAPADLDAIGWQEMIGDDHAIVLLEWPEILGDAVPPATCAVWCAHDTENTRIITIDGLCL